MRNEILRKRVIRLIAMSYAINEEKLWQIYEKIGNFERIIEMLENDELK